MLERRLSRNRFRGTRKHRRENAIHKDPAGALRAADLPTCLGSMEACCGAHHLAPAGQGYSVRLVPAQVVGPLVKSNESDYRDAEQVSAVGDGLFTGELADRVCLDGIGTGGGERPRHPILSQHHMVGERKQISRDGAWPVRWRAAGGELVYLGLDSVL